MDSVDVYLTAKQLRTRFGGISDMTIFRWLRDEQLQFPQPMVLNARRYWLLSDIQAWEQKHATGKVGLEGVR
jgi:predicted DNA-binding transcriptional regulator AlpA